MMKKIQVVTRYFYPVRAGIESHILEISKRLVDRGWDVEIHTSKDTLEEKNTLEDKEELQGIKIRRYSSFPLRFIPKLNYEKPIYLNNFNVFPHFSIFLLVLLSKFLGKDTCIFLAPHGGFTPWWEEFTLPKRLLKRTYHKTLGRFFINKLVKKVIAVSESEKAQLTKRGILEDMILIVPNGVEDLAFRAFKHKKGFILKHKPYILTICRIAKEKNIETVIKALSHLKEKLNFLILGDVQNENYYQYLRTLVKELNLDSRVFFLGFMSGKKKYQYIDGSEAFVLISWKETDPIAVKEAKARGKLIIVSNRGNLPYLVEDGINGFVVEPKEESVKRALEKVINLETRKKVIMGNTNLKNAKKYRWDLITDKFEYLLQKSS